MWTGWIIDCFAKRQPYLMFGKMLETKCGYFCALQVDDHNAVHFLATSSCHKLGPQVAL